MNKFKVGDKVVAYNAGNTGEIKRYKGQIAKITINHVTIGADSWDTINDIEVHYKQCRKLVRKEDKFQVGDKVKVYGGLGYCEDIGILNGSPATILEVQDENREGFPYSIFVEFNIPIDGTRKFFVHPKQCRKA